MYKWNKCLRTFIYESYFMPTYISPLDIPDTIGNDNYIIWLACIMLGCVISGVTMLPGDVHVLLPGSPPVGPEGEGQPEADDRR